MVNKLIKMVVPLLDLKAQYKTLRAEIRAAIDEVCESQQFILGPQVKAFEQEIALYSNTKHAIGVSSGTDALLVSLMALDIKIGDEVITPSYSFFATAGVIARLGAKPVFVDIDPLTYNINPSQIEKQITKRTKAIMPVHLYGQCCDMTPIIDIANRHNLSLIEDAAQAIGATLSRPSPSKGEDRRGWAGSMGDLGCFSFFPSKNLGGFGDGGMVVTNNPELAKKIEILRVHGSNPKYYHKVIGGNFRLDALQAAILQVKLKYLDKWTLKRQKNAETYNKLFIEAGLTGNGHDSPVALPYTVQGNRHIFNQYVIRAKDRNNLQNFLKANGIGTEVYYPLPLHLQDCFSNLGYKEGDFPESEKAAKETLALPIYPELTQERQEHVVNKIKEFYLR
ncbi:MAG TPA: DegT/DnrJ/EryC1/StrS family aminotransferase [Candidatus Brocadiales bacterium]|nr:DegT/DnrJ/EryC1/StrS family aminotransferase [Candidatus Brocadiales bacterium]